MNPDPTEPDEPFMTLPEVLIVGGLFAFLVGVLVLCWADWATADLKKTFDDLFKGW